MVGVQHILTICQRGHGVEVILVRAAGVGTHDQFVLLAKGVEFTVYIGIEAVVGLVVVIDAAEHQGVAAGCAHGYRAAGEGVLHVLGIF